MNRAEAYEYRRKIETAAASQDDVAALDSIDLFPAWALGLSVTAGQRYRYGGSLYKVIQAHTTQADWTPDRVPALWGRVSLDEWPEWVQPTGGHDAYNKGDKVTFQGRRYVSTIDGNVWSPAAYPAGWQEQA